MDSTTRSDELEFHTRGARIAWARLIKGFRAVVFIVDIEGVSLASAKSISPFRPRLLFDPRFSLVNCARTYGYHARYLTALEPDAQGSGLESACFQVTEVQDAIFADERGLPDFEQLKAMLAQTCRRGWALADREITEAVPLEKRVAYAPPFHVTEGMSHAEVVEGVIGEKTKIGRGTTEGGADTNTGHEPRRRPR